MLEAAGLPEDTETKLAVPVTDRQFVLDTKAYVMVLPSVKVYARADNLLGSSFLVSRRPFGARPSRPFLVQGGISYDF